MPSINQRGISWPHLTPPTQLSLRLVCLNDISLPARREVSQPHLLSFRGMYRRLK